MKKANKLLLYTCFFIVYIVWGSTYLSTIYALESIPPFFLVWTRLLLASILLYIVGKAFKNWQKPSKDQLKNIAVSSFLFLCIGLMGTVWVEQYLDSGLTALVISIEPLLVLTILWIKDNKKPEAFKIIGCFLGIVGMYFLVSQDQISGSWASLWAVIVLFVAVLGWALGAVFTSRADVPNSLFTTSSLQMLMAVPFIAMVSFFNEKWEELNVLNWEPYIYGNWLYLLICGSVLAYSAFNFLLTKVSPEKVSSSTYIHPIIALFLGWLIRNEPLTKQTLCSAFLMLLGVFFIVSGYPSFFKKRKLFFKKK